MNDRINDAIDQQIQGAIGQSRVGSLRRLMPQAPGAPTAEAVEDEGSLFDEMLAEDMAAEQEKQKQGGGGGIAGIIGSVMGG